ncbi:Trp biosynthesis-associated membrane protein, partial [Rhodococcus sp. (in: high G+C Gram-positive bacteria)]|uniref:Trp biosynthesis-associated membrane protein n=1 Tax=Rhodococcus sp. TaxID=1831 RepID=UPI00257D9B28
LMRNQPLRVGCSSKYDTPASRREAAAKLGQGDKPASDEPVTQRMLWDALDAGEDPTATDGDDGVGGDNGAKPGSSH